MSDTRTGTVSVYLTDEGTIRAQADFSLSVFPDREKFITQVKQHIAPSWESVGRWEVTYDLDGNVHNARQKPWAEWANEENA